VGAPLRSSIIRTWFVKSNEFYAEQLTDGVPPPPTLQSRVTPLIHGTVLNGVAHSLFSASVGEGRRKITLASPSLGV